MKLETVKTTMQHNHPDPFVYQKGLRIKRKRGRFTRTYKRRAAHNPDRSLSLEIVGRDKSLEYVEFMIDIRDPVKAVVHLKAVTAVVAAVYPKWDGEPWLLETIRTAADGIRKPLRVKFMELPHDLSVVFIKVGKGR